MFTLTTARSAFLLFAWTFAVSLAAVSGDEVELPCNGQCRDSEELMTQDENSQGVLLLHTNLAIHKDMESGRKEDENDGARYASHNRTASARAQEASEKVVQQLFSCFDRDHDGKVFAMELRSVAHALGRNLTDGMLAEMTENVDKGNGAALDLQDFGRLAPWIRAYDTEGEEHHARVVRAEFDSVFGNFDRNKDGVVTSQELLEAYAVMGAAASTPEEINRMVRSFDTNSNVAMDKNEYFNMRLAEKFLETLASAGRRPGGGGYR